jgi:hypothetical protein
VAKKRLNSLWSDYLVRYAPTESHAEILELILEARLKRLDIIAECMLRVFVTDGGTGQAYEEWLADFMGAEERNVLDLVQRDLPHYGQYFDHGKFTHSLLLRQQNYKEANDSNVLGFLRQGRDPSSAENITATASVSAGAAPSEHEPKARGRKRKFSQQQLDQARQMKSEGKSNNEIARLLYGATPTEAQRRSVPTTLKHHFGPRTKVEK